MSALADFTISHDVIFRTEDSQSHLDVSLQKTNPTFKHIQKREHSGSLVFYEFSHTTLKIRLKERDAFLAPASYVNSTVRIEDVLGVLEQSIALQSVEDDHLLYAFVPTSLPSGRLVLTTTSKIFEPIFFRTLPALNDIITVSL